MTAPHHGLGGAIRADGSPSEPRPSSCDPATGKSVETLPRERADRRRTECDRRVVPTLMTDGIAFGTKPRARRERMRDETIPIRPTRTD
ncbi:hypothetical protein C2R22_03480 [Salinigranum rubrum]|uniref:Uncharacterized protein n=1 Tax=Salinigranum rubrum TaxID=755307 RepID=A0A2I8VFY7_9EURY|nr:hypothetical protein C2R22_03480 [Salinigranum rubrum]